MFDRKSMHNRYRTAAAPEPVVYNIPTSAELKAMGPARPQGAFLDPNHTHFILVDDGSSGVYGTEIELRTRLEGAIAEERQLSDGAHSLHSVNVRVLLILELVLVLTIMNPAHVPAQMKRYLNAYVH